jgi:hypothetical protein
MKKEKRRTRASAAETNKISSTWVTPEEYASLSERYMAAESRALDAEIALKELARVKLQSVEESVAKLARMTMLCVGGVRLWQLIDETRELWESIQQFSPEFLRQCPWVDGYTVALDVFLNNLLAVLEFEKPAYMPPDFPRHRDLAGPHYVRCPRIFK